MLSLLASLHNAARDDPVTDVLSAHAAVWPTGLASNASLQERQTEELLCLVLTRGMAAHPQDATMLRMKADLQFAAGRHSAALSLYLESVAVKTDFFQVCPVPSSYLQNKQNISAGLWPTHLAVGGGGGREDGHLLQVLLLQDICIERLLPDVFEIL